MELYPYSVLFFMTWCWIKNMDNIIFSYIMWSVTVLRTVGGNSEESFLGFEFPIETIQYPSCQKGYWVMWPGINIYPDKVDSTVNYPLWGMWSNFSLLENWCVGIEDVHKLFWVDIAADQLDKEECGLEMEWSKSELFYSPSKLITASVLVCPDFWDHWSLR